MKGLLFSQNSVLNAGFEVPSHTTQINNPKFILNSPNTKSESKIYILEVCKFYLISPKFSFSKQLNYLYLFKD